MPFLTVIMYPIVLNRLYL